MIIPKLALRNILGAGLRTWLNVFALSLAFVAIIWMQGLIEGMSQQARDAMIAVEVAGGQFWHQAYDPYDPLTIEDAHAPLSPPLNELVNAGRAAPILIASGTIFPAGRAQTALLKGIDPNQQIMGIPSAALKNPPPNVIPALIGTRMAEQTHLKVGDVVTVRWRNIHSTFDAADVQIAHIMDTTVASVDNGQIWLPLATLREMLQAPEQATLLVVAKETTSLPASDKTWIYCDLNFLLRDLDDMIKAHYVSNAIMYGLLLSIALLAIFDTQVLSIFKRRKEIGTLMALGMPRTQVIGLFTFEGALHGFLALLVGAVYGIPLLIYSAKTGLAMPKLADNTGFAVSKTLYPSYGVSLLLWTTLLVLLTVTIVSFLPTRRISNLKPTDALKGKFS